MLALLEKIRFWIAALALGALFVMLAMFDIVDITKLQLTRAPSPDTTLLRIGLGLLVVGVLARAASAVVEFGDAIWLPNLRQRVKKTARGWCAQIGQTTVEIAFGKLQEIASPLPTNLVVLPANEFFDDECITDRNSALGAFVEAHFPGQKDHLLEHLALELRDKPTVEVERAEGVKKRSYQVGATVYLPRTLGTGWNILLVAVTTQRAGEGLRAEIRTIFTLANAIERTMADHRLNNVAVPIIGSGHGGLRAPAALSALVIAFIEILSRPQAHGIKNVTIVTFQPSPVEAPALSRRQVRRTVARAIDLYGI